MPQPGWEHEYKAYRKEHHRLFGHFPIPNLRTGQKCMHPIHEAIQRIIEAPGVHIELPFDAGEVATEDEPEVQPKRRRLVLSSGDDA